MKITSYVEYANHASGIFNVRRANGTLLAAAMLHTIVTSRHIVAVNVMKRVTTTVLLQLALRI